MRVSIALLAALLAGCAGTVRLIGDGKVHHGTLNTGDKSMQVVVDGEVYKGNWVMGQTTANSFGVVSYAGRKPVYGSTTATVDSNQGRVLLVSPSNKTIKCDLLSSGMRAQGQCVDSLGRQFDLIAEVQ